MNVSTLGLHILEHLILVLTALILGLCLALPLGAALTRTRYCDTLLGALGMLYTIPSLAMFALCIPIFGLGMPTADAVLTLYATVFLTRAVIAGLQSVPADTLECARAQGMTRQQSLIQVEFPLASPVIVNGIRGTVIMLIATATIAAWVDAGGLGVILFQGLRQDDANRILWGCAAATVLAILFDFPLAKWEARLRLLT